MLESGNPDIDIDGLMQQMRIEADRLLKARPAVAGDRILTLRGSVNLGAIESWVAVAEQKARVRSKWPNHLHIFPLSKGGRVQGLVLKLLAFAFKDQRQVNDALIAAFRESVTLNRQLIEQLKLLRDRVEVLERR
jgi:hypothetical protein